MGSVRRRLYTWKSQWAAISTSLVQLRTVTVTKLDEPYHHQSPRQPDSFDQIRDGRDFTIQIFYEHLDNHSREVLSARNLLSIFSQKLKPILCIIDWAFFVFSITDSR
ncbi:hypothetical protein SCLCIDRAFT_762393 [Scleroderma citrinum Foug A]|uniref:Uncharacterized protein n=1 Tax=Scleroderma citrinum Foug A TaxID=1036808 RepID=A0A0C3DRE9_9AGAM|nr:hypothetical protein SCLCIDRAFT_762393 [Scleroderma citrinum Foug A]